MIIRQRMALRAMAAFLLLSFAQAGVQITLAAENSLPIPQQLIIARVERVRGTAMTINGNNVAAGTTIMTASIIETGADTAVTINLGSIGTLDIAPNTRLELNYADDGSVRIKLIIGCAILRTRDKATGEVTTESGDSAGRTPQGGGVLDICIPAGGNPVVNQGAAAAAGASTAGASAGAAAAGGGGLFGLGTAATVAILGGIGAAIVLPIITVQGNSSETLPL